MRIKTPQRIAAWDRRRAAIHEAGHVIIGHRIGCKSTAWIYPNDYPSPGHKTWLGRTMSLNREKFNRLDSCLIACAGAAAECVWDGEEIDPEQWDDPDFMSPTDWETAECEPGHPDEKCVEAIRLLGVWLPKKRMWSKLLREARQLIVDARPWLYIDPPQASS